MRVKLDSQLCFGHGRCYALSPEVFDADDAGHCELRFIEVPVELEEAAHRGVDACPERALAIE